MFAGGNTESIKIQVSGTNIIIPFSEITAVRFSDEPAVTVNAEQAPAPQEILLNVEAALIYNYGGAQPVGRTKFYILDESAEVVLAAANLRKISANLSNLDNYAFALKGSGLSPEYTNFATGAVESLKSHYLGEFETDFNGKAEYKFTKTGSFWVFGITQTRKGHAIWNVPVELKSGQNKIILDQNNAASAF